MQKPAPSEVKPFQFGALEGVADTKVAWREFEMPPLGAGGKSAPAAPAKVIRAEREAESRTQFKIEGIVREYRGLTSQEQDDLEKRINIEVDRKLKETREAAYREGLDKGRLEGVGNAFAEASVIHREQIEEMAGIVEGLRGQCDSVLEKQHHDAYEMLKRMLKWLVLRDVSDQAYLPKLLEKLILEMSQRHNLLIRVHPEDFAAMPAARKAPGHPHQRPR